MSSLSSLLSARIEAVAGIDPELRPATKPQFGHYQSNVALRLANSERKSPREVAADIVARLPICASHPKSLVPDSSTSDCELRC